MIAKATVNFGCKAWACGKAKVVFLVWTPRGDDTAHLISCRYADRKEANDYFISL